MPIYAYRCTACGHAKDVLQKISDPLLNVCPACGAAAFAKQVTAAGFQLKGSGWYATDFRDSGSAKPPAADAGAKADDAPKSDTPPAAAPAADSGAGASSSVSGGTAPSTSASAT
jgi:putative FmdB family regulatory protein